MIVHPTRLAGVAIVELEPQTDARGAFARTFDYDTFRAHRLDPHIAQCNTSFNPHPGTLRGLHYQAAPHGEGKLIRCTRGRIYDVAVDLRAESSTHRQWIAVELSCHGARSLYIPAGCAHGFQTLEADSEVHYQMTVPYAAEASRGVRWDDPAFAIQWPPPAGGQRLLSDRDRAFPDYRP